MSLRAQWSVMVTGGHGFLGRHIVSALLEVHPGPIAVLDIVHGIADPRIESYNCDITDEVGVHGAIATFRPSCIIHTATALPSQSGKMHWRVNYGGTRNLLNAAVACGVTAFVHTSDACVLFEGKALEGADEDVSPPPFASHSYNDSKASAENLVQEFRGRNGLRVTLLRPSYLFGPGSSSVDMIMTMFSVNNTVSLEVGDNRNLTDWVYVDNAAQAHILAAMHLLSGYDIDGEVFIITNDDPRPFWDVPTIIWFNLGYFNTSGCRITNISPMLATCLTGLGQIIGFTNEEMCTLVQYYITCCSKPHWYNISKAKRVLGYNPVISVEEGIRRTISWYTQRHGT